MIDLIILQTEIDGLPPESKALVEDYLQTPSVKQALRNYNIRKRVNDLVDRSVQKTAAVHTVAGEYHLSESALWEILRECA